VARAAETAALTLVALHAFAANSILTRMALGAGHLDAATFTTVRLATGALTLLALARLTTRAWPALRGRGWAGPLALFAYVAPFSFAYVRIGAAAGALVLFGAVQITMIGWGLIRGERPGAATWVGLAMAGAGLCTLTLPSAAAPDPVGLGLMVVAGVAWGAYSLLGKGAGDPLGANARAFLWAVPLALALSALSARGAAVSGRGLALAAASGAVTSGVGYAVWYRALRGLTAARAAILQLAVPVLAGAAAVLFLHEPPTGRLAIAGALVIGGVALALVGPARARRRGGQPGGGPERG
jgi:drug/metabolite transporter (DMT)-like permease